MVASMVLDGVREVPGVRPPVPAAGREGLPRRDPKVDERVKTHENSRGWWKGGWIQHQPYALHQGSNTCDVR